MSTVLATNLVRTPGICGGRLRIDGTRMTVNQIITLHKQGLSAEEIVTQYPRRSLREIYAVFAWYHDNKEEFDKQLAAETVEEETARRQLADAPDHW
jgi:uncharacterized protein (DUF433 family)